MKTFNRITLIIFFISLIFTTNAQDFLKTNGFKWTDKKEYLCIVNSKKEAIQLCTRVLFEYSDFKEQPNVYELSKVPVFWWVKHPDKPSKVLIIYCIRYKDNYDVVVKEIEDKTQYFFSIEEENGEVIDLFYSKS
ncbi:MAG: hypothetical protein ACPG7H_07795 [Crocinitomicaceae bacterium]